MVASSFVFFFASVSDELLDEAADHFEAFFSEVFEELYKYGEVEDMVVCDNIGDHIIGNVYVKYSDDDAAKKALSALQGRYYAGQPAADSSLLFCSMVRIRASSQPYHLFHSNLLGPLLNAGCALREAYSGRVYSCD